MIEKIFTVIFAILSIAGGCIGYYFYIKNKIAAAVNGSINDAENLEENGESKKAEVVAQLQTLIPSILKPFITKQTLNILVQKAFDKIEEYAKKQIKKKASPQDGENK